MPKRLRSGRTIAFSIEPAAEPLFDRRLALPASVRGCWISLSYALPPVARPLRPMIRIRCASGASEDAVLPGTAFGAAHWLGYLPRDLDEILLAAEPGFLLERVGLRSRVDVWAECARRRPWRLAAAGIAWLRRDARRSRNLLRAACAVTPLADYASWKADRQLAPEAAVATRATRIGLVVAAGGADSGALAETIEGLQAQTHRGWRLFVATEATTGLGAAASDPRVAAVGWNGTSTLTSLLGDADAIGVLKSGDVLAPDALAILAEGLAAPERPDLIYADEESADLQLRPRLKPDWSPDLALVTEYLGVPLLLTRALVERIGDRPVGAADGSDLILAAITAARGRVAHIPRILCRRTAAEDDPVARVAALRRHLRAVGSPATASIADGALDLDWPVPEPAPSVSVVIPTRDRPDLIGCVTTGVLDATDYPALELVLVDNGSTDPATLRLYDRLARDPRVRIEADPRPFDFSGLANAGVRVSRGDVVVLLNNDIAVPRPDWLAVLVGQAVRPEVGAVGAKLLYPDGRLQHAGVVVGLGGGAGHILRRRPGATPGHLDRMRVAHEVSGVTAACLAVERHKFDAVGGFDVANFPIDFNDIDFCLRLAAAGWKTMWTPKSVLVHLESVSRGRPVGEARRRFEAEAAIFAERWRDVIRHDPFYHPALSLTSFGEDLE